MKKKLIITGITAALLFGGAMGVGAMSNSTPDTKPNKVEKSELISAEKAIEIAINETGGTFKNIELDEEDGRLIYETEVEKEGFEDIDLDIDAKTGEIIKVDYDKYDDDDYVKFDNHKTYSKKHVNISLEDAINIATKDTPGKVVDAEFGSEGYYYDVEIYSDKNTEVEIKVHAYSGKIIKKEIEHQDD